MTRRTLVGLVLSGCLRTRRRAAAWLDGWEYGLLLILGPALIMLFFMLGGFGG